MLVDGDLVVWDSLAILWHLASTYGEGQWLPSNAAQQVEMMQWLAVASNECLFGLARARATKLYGLDFDLAQCQRYGKAGLSVLEGRLEDRDWLTANGPTIADIACYPYVALCEQGDISLDGHRAVLEWMGRVQALPGYVDMPGLRLV